MFSLIRNSGKDPKVLTAVATDSVFEFILHGARVVIANDDLFQVSSIELKAVILRECDYPTTKSILLDNQEEVFRNTFETLLCSKLNPDFSEYFQTHLNELGSREMGNNTLLTSLLANEENHKKLQHYLSNKEVLVISNMNILDYLELNPKESQFTSVYMSTIFDSLSMQSLNDSLVNIKELLESPTSQLIWGSNQGMLSPCLEYLSPQPVPNAEGDLHFIWVAYPSDGDSAVVKRNLSGNFNTSFLKNLNTGFQMVSFPIKKHFMKNEGEPNDHQAKMEQFYRTQKKGYDAYREQFLHARPVLMSLFPIKKSKDMIWVDIGGGTARNLEYFPPEVLREYFQKIFVVDISASLLEIAQERVEQMGIADIVEIVECDVTDPGVLERLPAENTADVVTMSYALSMIPDKTIAIDHCFHLLKGNGKGFLGICDFFLEDTNDATLTGIWKSKRSAEASFHKWWFKQDSVHLLSPEHLQPVFERSKLVHNKRLRGGIPFLPLLKPVHGVTYFQSL